MSNPLFATWSGPDTRPFVSVFEPWDAPPSPRRSVPVSFTKVPVAIDPADVDLLRSCVDPLMECRRDWQRACEAQLRAALVACGAVPAGATDAEAVAILSASPGRLLGVVQPDGSRECFWGSAFLCTLPPDPVAAWRASVDARLRDGLF
jgi:hypothetical protein